MCAYVWFKVKYVVEETQKFEPICKYEESNTEETFGGKGFKNIRSEFSWYVGC